MNYVDEMEEYLKQKNPSLIYLNDGINSDSGSRPEKIDLGFLANFKLNTEDLFEVITEARVIKSEDEITLLKYIT